MCYETGKIKSLTLINKRCIIQRMSFNKAGKTSHEQIQAQSVDAVVNALRENADPAPAVVEIHPTDLCNQRCSYCFHGGVGNDASRRSEQLKPSDYQQLFQEAGSMGVQEISVSGGGEPFLYKGIDRVLESLADSPMRTRIVTHGNRINPEMDDAILAADEIRFSVDTVTPAEYNAMRGLSEGSNLVNDTLENMSRLVRARNIARSSGLKIAATVILGPVNSNPEGVHRTITTLVDKIGIDQLTFKSDIYGQVAPDTEQAKAVNEILYCAEEEHPDRITVRQDLSNLSVTGLACAVPYFKIALDPYGEVYSCCLGSQPNEKNGLTFGALSDFDGSFERLWAASKPIRDGMLKSVACVDCNHTDRTLNDSVRDRMNLQRATATPDNHPTESVPPVPVYINVK